MGGISYFFRRTVLNFSRWACTVHGKGRCTTFFCGSEKPESFQSNVKAVMCIVLLTRAP